MFFFQKGQKMQLGGEKTKHHKNNAKDTREKKPPAKFPIDGPGGKPTVKTNTVFRNGNGTVAPIGITNKKFHGQSSYFGGFRKTKSWGEGRMELKKGAKCD